MYCRRSVSRRSIAFHAIRGHAKENVNDCDHGLEEEAEMVIDGGVKAEVMSRSGHSG